ncbi:hypothetical protein EYF80_039469 [Liparis tanakae]|uniref:Uncharacterized protein n=1 Tax=Liparis tanakae TaxID=230148 RepID=A0A4Z2GAU5_9TELE|nr:hypothetical protein EYF80_039469 [Liparis tanakae]
MMQPPRSTVILQPQPRSGVSWFIPKLCPSSWAKVTAAPRGFSEWSCNGETGHVRHGFSCQSITPADPITAAAGRDGSRGGSGKPALNDSLLHR